MLKDCCQLLVVRLGFQCQYVSCKKRDQSSGNSELLVVSRTAYMTLYSTPLSPKPIEVTVNGMRVYVLVTTRTVNSWNLTIFR